MSCCITHVCCALHDSFIHLQLEGGTHHDVVAGLLLVGKWAFHVVPVRHRDHVLGLEGGRVEDVVQRLDEGGVVPDLCVVREIRLLPVHGLPKQESKKKTAWGQLSPYPLEETIRRGCGLTL